MVAGHRHLLATCVIVLVGAAGSVQGATAGQPTWSGTWSTEWGAMVLTQNGGSVSGTYPHDQGHIAGTVHGSVLIARWDEAPTRTGPNDAGTVKLTLKPDGRSFSGRWAYDGSPNDWHTNWNGTCVAGACLGKVTMAFALRVAGATAAGTQVSGRVTIGGSGTVTLERFDRTSHASQPGVASASFSRVEHLVVKGRKFTYRARWTSQGGATFKIVDERESRLVIPLAVRESSDPQCESGSGTLTLVNAVDDRAVIHLSCRGHGRSHVENERHTDNSAGSVTVTWRLPSSQE